MRIALCLVVILLTGCFAPVPEKVGVGISNTDDRSHTFHVTILHNGQPVFDEAVKLKASDERFLLELDPSTYRFEVTAAGQNVTASYDLQPGNGVSIGYSPLRGLFIDARELDYF